jgi:hypothetical protein
VLGIAVGEEEGDPTQSFAVVGQEGSHRRGDGLAPVWVSDDDERVVGHHADPLARLPRGLRPNGVNGNEGAESTRALVVAPQQARRLQAAARSAPSRADVLTAAAPTPRSAAP